MKKIMVAILMSFVLSVFLCSCGESTEDKVERLNRTAEQIGNQVSEQQQRIDDFQSDWDNYKRLESELKSAH
ncbi:MAG: hypothetical protein IJ598_08240 [Ruminococcus sp.]|nr:hypothetical protein [Ruminococcus sp.]